jgi:hypothetical protein
VIKELMIQVMYVVYNTCYWVVLVEYDELAVDSGVLLLLLLSGSGVFGRSG